MQTIVPPQIKNKPRLRAVRGSRLLAMLDTVIRHAREYHDGHFFILGFTTHYKGSFGTPDLDSGAGRGELWNLDGFSSVEELLEYMTTPSCGCIRVRGRR